MRALISDRFTRYRLLNKVHNWYKYMTWIVFVCNIDLYTGTVNKYVPQMSPFTFDFITFDDKRLQ